jgi:hypothetical protein
MGNILDEFLIKLNTKQVEEPKIDMSTIKRELEWSHANQFKTKRQSAASISRVEYKPESTTRTRNNKTLTTAITPQQRQKIDQTRRKPTNNSLTTHRKIAIESKLINFSFIV